MRAGHEPVEAVAQRCSRASAWVLDAQAFEGEGWPGAVPQEPFAPRDIGAMEADGCVEAEAAAGLQGQHVGDGVVVEEAAAAEEEEHAALQRTLDSVVGMILIGLSVGAATFANANVLTLVDPYHPHQAGPCQPPVRSRSG